MYLLVSQSYLLISDFRIRLTRKTEPKHEPKPPQPNAARHEMRPTDGDGMRNEDDQWAKKIALSR